MFKICFWKKLFKVSLSSIQPSKHFTYVPDTVLDTGDTRIKVLIYECSYHDTHKDIIWNITDSKIYEKYWVGVLITHRRE